VSRRMPPKRSSHANDIVDGNGGNGNSDFEDLDPTEDFPQWSKTLLLLLDYAMIEGIRRGLHMFVHLLDTARIELHAQVAHSLEETEGPIAERDPADEASKAARARRRRTLS
jgi:hypothetical protein